MAEYKRLNNGRGRPPKPYKRVIITRVIPEAIANEVDDKIKEMTDKWLKLRGYAN